MEAPQRLTSNHSSLLWHQLFPGRYRTSLSQPNSLLILRSSLPAMFSPHPLLLTVSSVPFPLPPAMFPLPLSAPPAMFPLLFRVTLPPLLRLFHLTPLPLQLPLMMPLSLRLRLLLQHVLPLLLPFLLALPLEPLHLLLPDAPYCLPRYFYHHALRQNNASLSYLAGNTASS